LDREKASSLPFEVIVVDDGSTDGTEAEIDEAKRQVSIPLTYLKQRNSGPATARNNGVSVSKGNLIIFLGDDIIVEPGYLNHIYGAYLRHGSDEAVSIVGFTRYATDLLSKPFAQWLENESGLQFAYPHEVTEAEGDYRLFYTSNVLVAKQALMSSGGFADGFRAAALEDTELGYRLQCHGVKIWYCKSASAVHVHPISLDGVSRRLETIAGAAMELKKINPELFSQIYPRAWERFGRPSAQRRFARWLAAGPLLAALKLVDHWTTLPVPGWLYSRSLQSVKARELARLWRLTSGQAG
jgi:glycosyltransferase involved in cell wall biosynthesis